MEDNTIFLVDVPDYSGGYVMHFVKWNQTYSQVSVWIGEPGGTQQVGSGSPLDYQPDPDELYRVIDGDGSIHDFRMLQYFPYAEEVVAQHPANGTFLRNDCNGVHLQQVLADGSGGERWGDVVEYNSATCDYTAPEPEPEPEPEPVVLGCTDPTAENYNLNATPGNADANVCTYAAKVFTEVKTVEVLSCAEGVCLRWFNSLGGIDTWLFQGKVDRPFASEAAGQFNQTNGLLGAASKSGQPSMVLRAASLNHNRYQALWQLYTSPKVWIHHPDQTTEEVYVQPSSLPAMPIGRNSYDITVEITKAPINTLRR